MQYSVKFVKNFIAEQFMNSTHKILILICGTEGEIVVAHGLPPLIQVVALISNGIVAVWIVSGLRH